MSEARKLAAVLGGGWETPARFGCHSCPDRIAGRQTAALVRALVQLGRPANFCDDPRRSRPVAGCFRRLRAADDDDCGRFSRWQAGRNRVSRLACREKRPGGKARRLDLAFHAGEVMALDRHDSAHAVAQLRFVAYDIACVGSLTRLNDRSASRDGTNLPVSMASRRARCGF